jgi:hypothetical protein
MEQCTGKSEGFSIGEVVSEDFSPDSPAFTINDMAMVGPTKRPLPPQLSTLKPRSASA